MKARTREYWRSGDWIELLLPAIFVVGMVVIGLVNGWS